MTKTLHVHLQTVLYALFGLLLVAGIAYSTAPLALAIADTEAETAVSTARDYVAAANRALDKATVNNTNYSSAKSLIEDAKEALEDAEKKLDIRNYSRAERYAKDAIDFVEEAMKKLDANITDYLDENTGDKQDAEDAIADAESEIAALEDAIDATSTNANGFKDAEEALADARAKLTEAKKALADKKYAEAEALATKAEKFAQAGQSILDDDERNDNDENDDDKDDKDNKRHLCHNGRTIEVDQAAVAAHLAHGDQEGECGDDEASERDHDRFKDFGRSTDRAELQKQIRELLQLLIELLTQQMAKNN